MEARHADQDRGLTIIGGSILVGLCIFFALLVGRLVQINTSMAPKLTGLVESQQVGRTVMPARRGCILDTAGRIVAGTRQKPSVFADPGLIENVETTARQLAPVLGTHGGEIEQMIREEEGHRFCWIKRLIDPVDAASIEALKLGGVGIQNEDERYYPMGSLMAQVIGIVGIEDKGLEGLELLFDKHLRGVDGERAAVYDGRTKRKPVWWRRDMSREASDGGHVVLTLDSVIQGIAEERVEATVREFEAESGISVVMSPRTGEVLALAHYPTFDPNSYNKSPADARRNRAICDAVEPGSTFKPYAACAALKAGVVELNEEIYCGNGQHYFGGRLMHDTVPQAKLNFVGIITKSSNIGMGILGQRTGNKALNEMVRAFGFGEATGVEFPGEAVGMLAPLDKWTSYSTTSVPIGQEISVTALQLATAMSAIVNGGTLLKPKLVRALLAADGSVLQTYDEPQAVRRVIPEDMSRFMTQEVLVSVVKNGGGSAAASADWQVCGKTGTAQIPYKNRPGYEPGSYISSFIGAAPAEDPQVVVLVMIRRPNPHKAYYGRLVAAPPAGAILSKTLAYMQVPPSPGMPVAAGPAS